MFGSPRAQYTTLIASLLVLLAILGWQFLPDWRVPSPEELARQALEAEIPREREEATARLAELANDSRTKPGVREEAKQQLRRVLAESQFSPVQAACLRGLAALWDYESMPALLDALEHESALVRGAAGAAVKRLLSRDLGYRHDDPPERRQQAVERIRKYWDQMRDSPLMKSWRERLLERGS